MFTGESFRVCPLCGHWPAPEFLCRFCRDAFEQRVRAGFEFRREFPIRYLLDWKVEDANIGHLIHSLKGSQAESAWETWVETFIRNFHELLSDNLIFVPAPSVDGPLDHAGFFAKHLARISGQPLSNCLVRKSGQNAKGRAKRDRLQIEFEWICRPDSGRRVIFVDDVLTTGATATAVFRALDKPIGFEAWVLARRQLAAPFEKRTQVRYNATNP